MIKKGISNQFFPIFISDKFLSIRDIAGDLVDFLSASALGKTVLKGVFAKNERGYRRNAKNKRF